MMVVVHKKHNLCFSFSDNPNTMGPAVHQPVYWNSTADDKNTTQEETQENDEYEVFVPPSELEIPSEMEIVSTRHVTRMVLSCFFFQCLVFCILFVVLKIWEGFNELVISLVTHKIIKFIKHF